MEVVKNINRLSWLIFDKDSNEILKIISDITLETVIDYNPSLEPLREFFKDIDINIFVKNLFHRKKELIDQKKSISDRADELTKFLSSNVPFDALEFRKRGIAAGIKSVEEKLMNGLRVNKDLHIEKEILYEIKYKIRDIEFKAQEVFFRSFKLLNQLFENGNPTVNLLGSAEYRQLKLRVEELENKFKFQNVDNKIIIELEAKKKELELELEEVNNSLSFRDQSIKIEARLTELLGVEKNLKEQISELESQERLYELYIRTKNEMLEARINKKFNFIKIKLFSATVNGELEEFYEICTDKGENIKGMLIQN